MLLNSQSFCVFSKKPLSDIADDSKTVWESYHPLSQGISSSIACGSGCIKSEIWIQVLSRNLSSTTPPLAARAQQQRCSGYVLVPVKCYEYGSKGFLIFLPAPEAGPSGGNHHIGMWSFATWSNCWVAGVLQLTETGTHFFRVASSH